MTDGLPVNSITAIIQDRVGYIWATTLDGLVRFDGVRFTVFNTSNSPQLPSNRFTSLKEGRDGSLWLVTEQLHLVRYRNGEFKSLPFEGGRQGEGVATLFVDSAGTVWVGTTHGLWSVRDDRVVPVARGTLDGYIGSITQRRDGSLLVGVWGAGLFTVAANGAAAKIPTSPEFDADSVVLTVEDSARVWIVSNGTLWRLDERLQNVMPLQRTPWFATHVVKVPATGEVIAATPSGLYRLSSGAAIRLAAPPNTPNTSVGLWTDGSAIWTAKDGDVLRNGRRVLSLSGRRLVSATLVDREGSLWLGTDTGLHRLIPALITTYSTPEGVANSNVYSTYVDRSGDVWVGTWGSGGVSRIDPATERVTSFSAGIYDFVNSFYEDESGRLWIGGGLRTGAGGVVVCAMATMRCRPDGPSELRGNGVYALHHDADGRLWAGSVAGVFRHDGRSWTRLPASSGAPNVLVRAFTDTRDGAVWMGTNGAGLFRYREGTFTSVTPSDGLPSGLIRSLYQDADGWLWIGTEGRGLARLDPRAWGSTPPAPNADRRIVRIGRENGLYDEVIHQILEDDRGRLWMNTNRGLFWVARAELNAFADGKASAVHSVGYAERDGMRNREGNGGVQPAGAKAPDGRLWFPTQDGVVVVDPARVEGGRRVPPVVVEHLVASGKPRRIERDSITLAPNERDVQIEYTALTFLQPANVRFRYRLDGYDADWVDAGNRRTAFYTKLPPKAYTFRVEATDAGGAWHPGATLALDVRPKLSETTLVRLAFVAALGGILVLAFRIRTDRLRARAAQLEQVVDERTATLRERERELAERNADLQSLDQAKTHFFANVSHELRTPLTLTIGPLEDLRTRANGDPQVERWLDIALRNSRRLLRLVNQLLDVAKLEAKAMRLTPRSLDLVPFTRGVVGAFASVADRKRTRLDLVAPDTLVGTFDTDAVEKILSNLLSNAIKFTPSGGSIDVRLAGEGELVRLEVRNSGPGIPSAQLPHVFERFYTADESGAGGQPGTGIGLSLVKELVELHGGTITVESGNGGTRFAVTLRPLAATTYRHPEPAGEGPVVSLSGSQEPDASPGVTDQSDDADVPTLLIVDDSEDLRTYIRDHFASRFRVIEAGNGAEGIALARQNLPDVVVSDVMMPGTDGHELVRALRASPETSFLSIILLTAQAGDEQRLDALERGADEYMVKPFEMRELDVRIRNLIASRRRLRERFRSAPSPVAPPEPGLAPDDRAYVTRVREAIHRGLGDPDFGVGELADALAQDRSRVFRRIRELLGEAPSLLIRRMRLEEGARLLGEGTGTVGDVAYAVGFNSVSYFCRCFQDMYGVTPAEYRGRGVAVDRDD